MILVRQRWFRILLIVVLCVLLNALYLVNQESILRADILTAIKNSALIFTMCAALSIALFSNYIKGIKDVYDNQVLFIRDFLGDFIDKAKTLENSDVNELKEELIYPLLECSSREWDNYTEIGEKLDVLESLEEQLSRIAQDNTEFFHRYILRLEDELNKLGVLFVRRVVTSFHMKTIKGVFTLILSGLIITGTAYLLPKTELFDLIIFNLCTLIFLFSIFELLLLVSNLQQEANEEMPEVEEENET